MSLTETSERGSLVVALAHPLLELSVHGLNLAVPEDAKELIKPWSERESTDKYADSGVDDQVRSSLFSRFPSHSPF